MTQHTHCITGDGRQNQAVPISGLKTGKALTEKVALEKRTTNALKTAGDVFTSPH